MLTFYTIGHSSHTPEHFVGLLRQQRIQVVADTRSAPYRPFLRIPNAQWDLFIHSTFHPKL